jgi:polyisoprenoid-binding protein YceI
MKISANLTCIMLVWMLSNSRAQAPNPAVYNIDATRSSLEIAVFRGGLLKIAGHDHAIAAKTFSGEVRFNSASLRDSSVNLSIESESLTVLDPDVSEKDRKEIQATMLGGAVLNVKAFPRILFSSTRVSQATNAGADFTLTGKLSLHGVEKEISFPVHIRPENDLLRATGKVTIAQTDFGIKPIKVALGTIQVKDRIEVKFEFLADRIKP